MHRLRMLALALGVLALVTVIVTSTTHPAFAVGSQIRTFVASTGSDANPCTRTAPCRTFGAALAQTASGGEIVALDSGGYGAVTITQSVTIVAAPGVQASISPSSGNAITVNAGSGDTIVLRNLNLNGLGATHGVHYQAAGSLHIVDLTINGFTTHGIFVDVSSLAKLHVANTVLRANGGAGIALTSTLSGTAHATIERVRAEKNHDGISVGGYASANVKDSVASGNVIGFVAYASAGGTAEINLESCTATGNSDVGIFAGADVGIGIARASNCMVIGNNKGVFASANGTTYSRGNNTVEGNSIDGSFSSYYAAK